MKEIDELKLRRWTLYNFTTKKNDMEGKNGKEMKE